jgi:DNA-binding NarL/FixJ family response regulator
MVRAPGSSGAEASARMIALRGTDRKHRVIIVDGQDVVRHGLRALVEALPDFTVCGDARSSSEARRALRTRPDIAVLGLDAPDDRGIELIRALKAARPQIEILVLASSIGDRMMAELAQAGARGCVLKSDSGDRIGVALAEIAAHRAYVSPTIFETLGTTHPSRGAAGKPLTLREREVVQLVASGHTNKRIAALLDISVKTVETHRLTAMHKIGARSAADVTRYALRNDLV